jgi:hypothetical protein
MNTWEFDTLVGAGSEVVTVVYEYEQDLDSTFNESIREVWFEGRNCIGLLTDEAFRELDCEAAMRFQHHKLTYKQTEDYQP